ncbi:MAG TPA: hypothetical protein VFC19_41600 [Candidatus Limnocylindrales bacterium]|nr:hypothetical protein [Candidatus Limnocylindrales bacterium]
MDIDNSRDVAYAGVGVSADSLSLPLAVLGDLPARGRFHRSQEAAAQAMESLLSRVAAASGECVPMSAP